MELVRIDLREPFDPSTLTPAERERAERFGSEDRRRRWAAGRSGLRRALANTLDIEPHEVVIIRGDHGKPALAESDLHFNKTDCGDLALVALCRGREVGIDLEAHRPVLRSERIAARFFSEDERNRLAEATDPTALFFDLWTTKEAVLKCDGGGLGAFPMSGFTAPADLVNGGAVAARWWVRSVEVGSGLSAAVALDGADPEPWGGI